VWTLAWLDLEGEPVSNSRLLNPKRAAALRYARRGVPVFPLRRNKKPFTDHGFKDATTDLDQIKEWWSEWPNANIGVPTGRVSGIVVVDVDDAGSLPALDLPPTYTVATGRGVHLYFRWPGVEVHNDQDGKLGAGIHFRGDGGYVVAPGSVHESGKTYRVTSPPHVRPAELPMWTLDRLDGARPAPAAPGKAKPRHDVLRDLSWQMLAAGIESESVKAALFALDLADPALGLQAEGRRDEIARLVDGAVVKLGEDPLAAEVETERRRREVRRRAGELDAANALPNPAIPALASTAREELEMADEQPDWQIEGLSEVGHNVVIVGREKTGKTVLAMNIVPALLDGELFLGYFNVTQTGGKVMYINYQMTPNQFRRWLRGMGLKNTDDFIIVNSRGKSLPLWMAEVGDQWAVYCQEHNVKTVILDTASDAWRGLVTNENDNAQLTSFGDRLDLWKATAGVESLYILHHMPKGEQMEDEETGRGAIGFEGWADSIWVLTIDKPTDDGSTPTRYLRTRGRDTGWPAMALTYNHDTRRLLTAGATRAEQRTTEAVRRVLVELMREDGLPTNELRDRAGLDKNKGVFGRVLREALQDGLVERLYPLTKDELERGLERGKPAGDEPSGNKPKLVWLTDAGRRAMAAVVKVRGLIVEAD
jgi:hypothetical protein